MAYFRETLPKCVRARRESVSPSSLAHLFSAFQRTPMIFESRDSVSLSLFVCVSFRFSSIRFDSKWSRRQKHHVLFAAIRFIDDAFLLAFSALALVLFSLLAFVNNGRLVSKYLQRVHLRASAQACAHASVFRVIWYRLLYNTILGQARVNISAKSSTFAAGWACFVIR